MIEWIYEQLDKHDGLINSMACGTRIAYWVGYRDALRCALLTLKGSTKKTHTERELREFVERNRP